MSTVTARPPGGPAATPDRPPATLDVTRRPGSRSAGARCGTIWCGSRPPAWRAGLTWPRLPAAAEVAITGAGYLAYALMRLAVRAGRHAAFAHATELWRAERWLHLDAEPTLNHLVAARHDPADHPGDQPPARSPSPPAAPARTRHALAELATPPPGRSRWYHQLAQLARDGGITLVS